MADRSVVIGPPGDTAWIYDPQHDALQFISAANASLYTYDLTQGTFAAPLALGGTPSTIAITPDGRDLLIGNSATVGGAIQLTRVDLATRAIDHVQAPALFAQEGGPANLVVDASGQAIFDTNSSAANTNGYRTFAASAASPIPQAAGPFAVLGDSGAHFGPGAYLLTSPDHRFVLVQQPNVGPSLEALYDTATHAFIAVNNLSSDFNSLPIGSQSGRGDVTNGGLIVDVTYNDVRIFDAHLQLVKNLSNLTSGGDVAGAVFSQDARELFLWNASQHKVIALDTQTWAQIGSTTTTLGGFIYNSAPAHDMQLVDHGTMLALDDGGRVELIDLAARFGLTPGPPPNSPDPFLPIAPSIANSAAETIVGDMDHANLSDLLPAVITQADNLGFAASGPNGLAISISGSNFSYANNQLVGGVVNHVSFTDVQGSATILQFTAGNAGLPAAQFETWLVQNNTTGAFQTLLGGNDLITGGPAADVIHGYSGDDLIYGLGGADTIYGGLGNDVIREAVAPNLFTAVGAAGSTYLRGEDGDDFITGGQGFDDINGNQGNDTVSGGPGDDWTVGGKDDDLLFGDDGDDIVWGNLGNDTCVGGSGNDQIRGGQGDDVLYGGAGNDYISGDRGNDTESGGPGADLFHSFSGAGLDRVLDFNAAEGDRVMLDPGTSYTVSQVGADTVVDMGNGDRMILVGVQLASLPAGWIFLG
jgi:Ca2+-binding RTX toxin-like protein